MSPAQECRGPWPGEVGKPLLELVSRHHKSVGLDVAPSGRGVDDVAIMHVCYPFEIKDFVGETARYVERFRPRLTIVNSTVGVGTNARDRRENRHRGGTQSGPRKHARMPRRALHYDKFIGAMDATPVRMPQSILNRSASELECYPPRGERARQTHRDDLFRPHDRLVAEVERYCDQLGQDYDENRGLLRGSQFFPSVKYFPGIIGGHCVMPTSRF